MMFSKYLSRYLAHYLVKNKFISEEEYSIYQYCIDYIIEMGIFFFILETISHRSYWRLGKRFGGTGVYQSMPWISH